MLTSSETDGSFKAYNMGKNKKFEIKKNSKKQLNVVHVYAYLNLAKY